MSKVTFSQGIQIMQMLERGDYDREFAQALIEQRVIVRPPNTAYRGEQPVGVGSALPPHHYRITVASTETPTHAALNAAYDWVSDVWDESKYKLELHESLREVAPPTGEVTVFVKKFDRDTGSEKAIQWADDHGYRLLFPWEREAFAKANPDLQRKFWIVDLGSFIILGGVRVVPVLGGGDGERRLGGRWFGGEWRAGGRFLFVSK